MFAWSKLGGGIGGWHVHTWFSWGEALAFQTTRGTIFFGVPPLSGTFLSDPKSDLRNPECGRTPALQIFFLGACFPRMLHPVQG